MPALYHVRFRARYVKGLCFVHIKSLRAIVVGARIEPRFSETG